MAYNKYFLQKTMFAALITIVNVLCMSLAYTYSKYWYYVQIPLLIVLFFNIATVLLAVFCGIFKRNKKLPYELVPPTTVGYFIPCYNESFQQINNSLQSFFIQVGMQKHKQFYFTVCDGRKLGSGNSLSTDKILKQEVFPNCQSVIVKAGYASAEGTPIDIELLTGTCPNGNPYFTIIKQQNLGKRDSIAIMRRLFYAFNTQKCPPMVNPDLLVLFTELMRAYGIYQIQFVIGVDADTVFQPNCSIQLLMEICRKPNILATSGMVKVAFQANQSIFERLWEGYQHVQYLSGQGFLRNQQNLTQQKINCLPGCLNITRVCEQTCGQLMLGQYMRPPTFDDHIFQQIRATASEDRHSVMLLLKLNRYCHTTVNWCAQAKTAVPTDINVFLSQRRRWSLGSATHGTWLVFMPNIPIWQRYSSLVFVLTYLINPFLLFSAIIWLYVLINGNGDTTFYILTGIVQMVTLYKLLIGVWCPLACWERAAYYLFFLLYFALGPLLGIMVLCYSLYNMDDFGWGKTRQVVEEKSVLVQSPNDITTPPFITQTPLVKGPLPYSPRIAPSFINTTMTPLEGPLSPRNISANYIAAPKIVPAPRKIPTITSLPSTAPSIQTIPIQNKIIGLNRVVPPIIVPTAPRIDNVAPSLRSIPSLNNLNYYKDLKPLPSTIASLPSTPTYTTLPTIPSITTIPSSNNLARLQTQMSMLQHPGTERQTAQFGNRR